MIQEAKDQDERDLTEEEATRRETPGPEYAAARMRWVGTRAERALRQEAEARSDRDRVAILLPAAREVHSAVSDLLINSEVWAPLGDAAAGLQALDDRQMRDIQQVFDQDLAALLSYLGYRPPPPAHHMELELRDAVEHALLDVRMRDVAPMTTIRAKNSLYVFAYRLRRLTRQAEHDLKDNDEVNGPQRLAVAARDLRAVTLTAVRAAGPSAIAAAATALVFPPAAAALGMNAATEAAKEAVKRLVELGGLSVLTRLLAEDVSTAPREAMLSGAAAGTAAWMTDLAATAIDLALDDRTARSRRIEPICIASISASYGVLQAAALVSGPTEAIKETCQRAIDVAQQVRQLVDDGATYGGDRRRVP